MRRLNLSTRTFLLSFVPVCLLLLSVFIIIGRVTHERIRKELRDAIYESGRVFDRAYVDLSRNRKVLLSKLTDSAGLKASVGLLAETGRNQRLTEQATATIQAQLGELQESTLFSYLAISDTHRRLIASLPPVSSADRTRALPPTGGLAEINGSLYELQSVPIEIDGEVAGILTVGQSFDLKSLTFGGEALLLKNRNAVRSTFLPHQMRQILSELKTTCFQPDAGCEVTIDHQPYVAFTLQSAQLGQEYKVIVFRSLGASLSAFNQAFVPNLVEIAFAGILFAFLCTLTTSRSITRPLVALSSQLESAAQSGSLPEKLDCGQGVREIDLVATAFNRLSAAERRSRNELIIAKQAAEGANRLKTEFLNNVSHELKTPMNAIVGMAEMMTTTEMTEEQVEYVDTIRSSSGSLMHLIEEILDFSELEAGRLRVRRSPVDVRCLLDDIATVMRASATQKPIAIEALTANPFPEHCLGDEKRMRQILMHLCENAVKYTEAGFIRVSAEFERKSKSQGVITFGVEDSGMGIAPENLEFIFQPFTQLDGSLTRRQGGTGVGLSVVKGLVELMGGQVGAKSTLHVGSKFWFALPVEVEENVEAHPEGELLEIV